MNSTSLKWISIKAQALSKPNSKMQTIQSENGQKKYEQTFHQREYVGGK